MVKTAPFGSWKSPITAELVTGKSMPLEQLQLFGREIYWAESRPTDGGRATLVRRSSDGSLTEMTAAPFNPRTRVHEYGGLAYTVAGSTLFFTNFADQYIYRVDQPGQAPRPLFTEAGIRHADLVTDLRHNRLIAIREDHNHPEGQQPVNSIVAIGMDGGGSQVLISGNDFYSTPRLSPDGSQLAWLTWNHPYMPWDGTELWVAHLAEDGSLQGAHLVAGGQEESIFQPHWSPDGVLHFVSDRTGWWNLYRWEEGKARALCPMEAEFGLPAWQFGAATYGFLSAERILCSYFQNGIGRLAYLEISTGRLTPIETPFTYFSMIRVGEGQAAFAVGAPDRPTGFARLDLASGQIEVIRSSSSVEVGEGYISRPRPIEFPTENGLTAHAIFYPPANADYQAPAGERPPLIVLSHGGPTGAAYALFNPSILYWTSRGFGVVDVNYGGSVGYGRAYRNRLRSTWGIVDVEDCAGAARYLVATGEADGDRLVIRGGSAGGYTTLAALVFKDLFRAGVSFYGVSDLELLARETHKFESRYLDLLVGPYPEAREVYRSRSPVHFTDRLSCPILFFQGLDDKVVPPSQAEIMVDALKAKGLPVAYVAFEGEGHGFRNPANNRRALEGQLYFFSRLFRFTPADEVEPLLIENLGA